MALRPKAQPLAGAHRKLVLQREISRLLSPLAIPVIGIVLRWVLGYRIEDIRYFWRNDLRFLEQF